MRLFNPVIKSVLAALILALPMIASADLITFNYDGICITGPNPDDQTRILDCSNIGLSHLSRVSGFLEVDSNDSSIGDYGFNFGNISLTSQNSAVLGGVHLSGRNIVGGLLHFERIVAGGNVLTLTPGGGGLWNVRIGVPWRPARWQFAGGIGRFSSVPEPGALALFSLGLLGLGVAARRREVRK